MAIIFNAHDLVASSMWSAERIVQRLIALRDGFLPEQEFSMLNQTLKADREAILKLRNALNGTLVEGLVTSVQIANSTREKFKQYAWFWTAANNTSATLGAEVNARLTGAKPEMDAFLAVYRSKISALEPVSYEVTGTGDNTVLAPSRAFLTGAEVAALFTPGNGAEQLAAAIAAVEGAFTSDAPYTP